MGGEDCRGPRLGKNTLQIVRQGFAGRGIEGTEGLVEEDHLRFRGKGPCQAGTLCLAAGQLASGPPGKFGDSEPLQGSW